MAHANITTSNGTKISIKGNPEEIAAIIKSVQGSYHPVNENIKVNKKHKEGQIISKKDSYRKDKKPSATDLILELREEEFFNKPKGLADIKSELATQGHHYPMSTLSGVVLPLVKKRELRRMKENKKWVYVRS